MFKRIMIALDGSAVGEAILPLADKLMRAVDARVHLVRVVPVYVGGGMRHPEIQKRVREARDYLEPIAGRLRDEGVNAHAELRFGLPVEELLKYAAVEGIDLIAMTTHGRTGMRRWMLGSVTEQVIRAAAPPLLVMKSFATVPAGVGPDTAGFERILVTLDGTPFSERILPSVAAVAPVYDSKVVVMTVLPESAPGLAPAVPPSVNWPANPRAYLSRVCESLRKQGVAAEPQVEYGVPADRIAAYLEANDVDLVAMATHGRSGVSRWVLGSVLERVLRSVHTPILAVRIPGDDEKEAPGNGQDS